MPSNQMTIDTNEDERFYINLHEVQIDRELIQAVYQIKKE
ncbi:hypothetical protein SOJ_28390 [Staphylococcus sp. OJ82]|nr:hypothetical protein SOJ_28390 [Staphylococcus sp. OJ82]